VSSINILDLYERFGNFFEIDCKYGDIYEIGEKIDNTIDPDTIVPFAGKYFSYKPQPNSTKAQPNLIVLQRFVSKQFELKLVAKGYKLRKWGYCAYRIEDAALQPHKDVFEIFRGFVYRVLILEEQLSLCIDPHLVLETRCSIHNLVQKGIPLDELDDFSVRYDIANENGINGYLIDTFKTSTEEVFCKLKGYRKVEGKPQEEIIAPDKVFPEARPELLQKFILRLGSSYSIIDLQRRLSYLDSTTASRDRFRATLDIVTKLSEEIFPLKFGNFVVNVKVQPIIVKL
jgi:hypothetical protein